VRREVKADVGKPVVVVGLSVALATVADERHDAAGAAFEVHLPDMRLTRATSVVCLG
jgi:hypothetical protein